MAREHQDEFVECSCAKDQRESLISKLKSYGATNAEEGVYYNNDAIISLVPRPLPHFLRVILKMWEWPVDEASYNDKNAQYPSHVSVVKLVNPVDANYCVVKFSVVREVGSIVKVLKAFSVS